MSLHISISKVKDVYQNDIKYLFPFHISRFQDLADVIATSVWSPIVWKGGHRTADNYQSCQVLVLDYDIGKPTLAEMKQKMDSLGLRHIIGTTRSHQKDKKTDGGKVKPACDRYRLVVATNQAFCNEPLRFRWQMERLQKLWPVADNSCKDQARFFFPCTSLIMNDGQLLSLPKPPSEAELQAKLEKLKQKRINRAKLGELPRRVDQFLNHGTCDERRPMCHYTGAELARFGWTLDNTIAAVLQAPFDRAGLTDREIEDLPRQITNGWKVGIKDAKKEG